jgi:LytS/YehU family sensor histidine kinase
VSDGTLHREVRDTGSGRPADRTGPEGIGLSNTRARLTRLYRAQHQLEFVPIPTGGASVQIDIPLRRAAPAGRTT